MRARVVLAVIAMPLVAGAGRSHYGWLYGTETIAARTVELDSWISEQNAVTEDGERQSETSWSIVPLVGLTDQLELGLPVEVAWSSIEDTRLDRYGVEVRYRFELSPITPFVRVGIARSVVERSNVIPDADLVASYETGRVHVLADIGTYGEIGASSTHFEVRPGIGISVRTTGQLRVGAEVHAELTVDEGSNWAVIGPNIAWSRGRFWISGTYGLGIEGIRDAPRVQTGIAF